MGRLLKYCALPLLVACAQLALVVVTFAVLFFFLLLSLRSGNRGMLATSATIFKLVAAPGSLVQIHGPVTDRIVTMGLFSFIFWGGVGGGLANLWWFRQQFTTLDKLLWTAGVIVISSALLIFAVTRPSTYVAPGAASAQEVVDAYQAAHRAMDPNVLHPFSYRCSASFTATIGNENGWTDSDGDLLAANYFRLSLVKVDYEAFPPPPPTPLGERPMIYQWDNGTRNEMHGTFAGKIWITVQGPSGQVKVDAGVGVIKVDDRYYYVVPDPQVPPAALQAIMDGKPVPYKGVESEDVNG